MTDFPHPKEKRLRIAATLCCFALIIFLLSLLKTEDPLQAAQQTLSEHGWQLVQTGADSIQLKKATDVWEFQMVRDDVARVQIKPGGKFEPDTAVLAPIEDQEIKTTFSAKNDKFSMSTRTMSLELDAKQQTLAFYDKQQKQLLKMLKLEDLSFEVAFAHQSGEQFYGIHGFSANQDSAQKMVRDGAATIEAGSQGNAGAPFIWSLQRFGLLFDVTDGSFTNFDNRLVLQNRSKTDLQYFVMVGEPLTLQRSLAELSGKPPMFPKWSIGFNNSEWGIDQQELERDVALYRQKQIPIDNYTLDFDWKAWGEDNNGESRWNQQKFPDGQSGKLKQRMDLQGIKLTGIMKPRIHVDTIQGREAGARGFWWPELKPFEDYFSKKQVNVLNFALPEMRKWYFNEDVKRSFATGIIGWWNDEADEMLDNLQFMNMQRTLYDGQRSISNQRVWSINRNFFLGSQRYAYSMWSGDINTGFSSMANQRERMLSAVNLGQAKWGMDTGGFHGTPTEQNYARWVQFSAFTPMFRVHGTLNEQRQPWLFGTQAEKVAKSAIELRYQLVPYIYSYERQAYETGIGLIKPLLYDYPSDERFANYVDAWMFGDHLLVSPVVEEDQTEKEIVLPTGEWIDYFSGKTYQGDQTLKRTVDAKGWTDIPLFIKRGAIIPKYPVMNYIGEQPVADVTIDLFPDEQQTSFVFYDDDGLTYDYEKGVYYRQPISLKQFADGSVSVQLDAPGGSYRSQSKQFTLQVHGVAGKQVTGAEQWSVKQGPYGVMTTVRIPLGSAASIKITP